MAKILVTGGAGFIGFHVAKALLERGDEVVIVDNFCDYYDVALKEARIKEISNNPRLIICRKDVSEFESMKAIFEQHSFDKICHLAAQAGVRYSLKEPFVYQKSNIQGLLVLLELARQYDVKDFVFASSSSVYGTNKKTPFSEEDKTDTPVSLYAATKKAGELIAHTYHHLYGLNCTGLRFFTVYGPWGRPDMAPWKFTEKISKGEQIEVYNNGKCQRDFTYVGDITRAVLAAIDNPCEFEIINVGNNKPVELMKFIETIENILGKKANMKFVPAQPGDVETTYADIEKAQKLLNYSPETPIENGMRKFIEWYKKYAS